MSGERAKCDGVSGERAKCEGVSGEKEKEQSVRVEEMNGRTSKECDVPLESRTCEVTLIVNGN